MSAEVNNAAPAAPAPPSIDAAIDRIVEISTLPHIAVKVMEIARDPNAGAADLKRVVEGDPALSGRVLRSINSAAYGLRATITNLHHAISYLGFSEIRNLAMTASVAKIFKTGEAVGRYRRDMLWRHMVSVGLCARLIATRSKLASFEDCFLAGLLHDIGIILEDQHLHQPFRQVIQGLDGSTPLCEVERDTLGFDHTTLGSRIAEKWHFPSVVRAAIRFHHMSQQYRGEDASLIQCVEVANLICTLKGTSSVGQKLVKAPVYAFQVLNLSKEDIVVLASDLDREVSLNEGLFEL
ncbi:MAG TPA: HDOD domain-containing protein [Phycisphaerae bacterium]|nr:HDOD domain-containing protein [Phycisphaerae bacterium]